MDVAMFRDSGAFDEQWYVSEYPDVARTGIDPARHYLWVGRRIGRRPRGDTPAHGTAMMVDVPQEWPQSADAASAEPLPTADEGPDLGLIDKARRAISRSLGGRSDPIHDLVAQHFDTDFYLTAYPDVAAAGVDPVRHYIDNGWREGRDPSLSFSTRYYVENNPDVVAAGVNPFYHFVAAGRAEGRTGKHQLGFRWDILANLKPVADQISELKSHRGAVALSSSQQLLADLKTLASTPGRVVLSFSHDDFTKHVGGVQLLLRRELSLFRARGDAHVHLFPAHSLPFLDTSGDTIALGVLINGKLTGYFTSPDIARALRQAGFAAGQVRFVLHSLLGHNMDQTIDVIAAAGATAGCLWLHDYSPIYNNFKLLRNGVQYRGYPRPGTIARELCAYARASFDHAHEFERLFSRFRIDLVSPSQTALDIWQEAGLFQPASVRVVEHVRLEPAVVASAAPIHPGAPLRVGFLGYPAAHKGWPVFEELVLRFGDDPRYEFHHLGKGRRGGLALTHREVAATADKLDAMREAVNAVSLDVAILWSIWPETFCLTAYEALAGGSAILTNPDAGNVVAITEKTGLGAVLPDEAALYAAFASGSILTLARSARPASQHVMRYSALSLEVVE